MTTLAGCGGAFFCCCCCCEEKGGGGGGGGKKGRKGQKKKKSRANFFFQYDNGNLGCWSRVYFNFLISKKDTHFVFPSHFYIFQPEELHVT